MQTESKKANDEFCESLVNPAASNWTTAPVAAMETDDAGPGPTTTTAPSEAGTSGTGKSSKVAAGLKFRGGVDGLTMEKPIRKTSVRLGGSSAAQTTMKRGQRTKNQRKRKGMKLEKAMARVEQIGQRVATGSNHKIRKLSLKHMY
jgi:hypothetical protein